MLGLFSDFSQKELMVFGYLNRVAAQLHILYSKAGVLPRGDSVYGQSVYDVLDAYQSGCKLSR